MSEQKEKILAMLKAGEQVTPYSALERTGSLRLSERIRELKADGYIIKTEMIKLANGKRVASYKLLPSIEDVSGLVPDFTNGVSLKEYMEESSAS